MSDEHINWWLVFVVALLAVVLYGPRFAGCDTPIPLELGIAPNGRLDNGLYCLSTPPWGKDCPGGWMGFYLDSAGNKHPDAHFANMHDAIAGIPDQFGRPLKPPGYPTFGHPKFRCYENCGNGGWSYAGWPG